MAVTDRARANVRYTLPSRGHQKDQCLKHLQTAERPAWFQTDNQVNHTALMHDAPGLHPDDQACQAKARGAPGGPPNLFFGLWLDRPGHQDGALGHHAGVLHDSPDYLLEIMQDIPQFGVDSGLQTRVRKVAMVIYSSRITSID